jgi:hypothetical protein
MRNFILLAAFIALVNAHAVLVTPTPWNISPSKTNPCGGGSPTTVAQAVWPAGSVQTISWRVVASDGSGTVSIQFDTKGGTANPDPTTKVDLGNAAAVGNYDFPLTVPNVACNALTGLCTAMISSSSGWYSCFTVKIVGANVPQPPPPGIVCTKPDQLVFCLSRNRQNIAIQEGQTPNAVDKSISDTYQGTLKNINVFANGNDTNCANKYKEFLCKNYLPSCGYKYACKSLCQETLQVCGIQPSHASLYDCNAGPDNCNSASVFTVAVAVLVALALLF